MRHPRVVAGTLTALALIFLFGATRELREGVKLHNVNVGVFAGVQHYNWQKAMTFIGERARPEDVIISARSLAARYYGPQLPLYYLNHQELDTILSEYPRDKDGQTARYRDTRPHHTGRGHVTRRDHKASLWLVRYGAAATALGQYSR